MDGNFFALPFIRDAEGPLAYAVMFITVALMVWDRVDKAATARRQQKAEEREGQEGKGKATIDRFEVISEAEARLRDVYAQQNTDLRTDITRLQEQNRGLQEQLTETQRELSVAQGTISQLERQVQTLQGQINKGDKNV